MAAGSACRWRTWCPPRAAPCDSPWLVLVMSESRSVSDLALHYFLRPRGHFWRWVEEGKVIEWRNSNTLCYREELARVLRSLTAQGFPPLAPVLLLLAACSDSWPRASGGVAVLENLLVNTPAAPDDPALGQLKQQLHEALCFMGVVRMLPLSLRSDVPKLHLFREVFQAQAPHLSAEASHEVLVEWDSGRLDEVFFYSGVFLTLRRFSQELDCLAQAYQRFPTTEQLALRLRTGLDQLPPPLPTPEPPAAPDQPLSLLDQLSQDQRTAGLANLAQHLVAALHVPLHARGASDQPLGGVADITNRGNFDRLLLSELAHDDLTLTARLVNNEALYLRREEPPRPQARPRAVLLDTTLRLWGTPRVFGLAAALAWAYHAQLPRTRAALTAYALGGQASTPLDLDSVAGVVQALGCLDPALHCGPALAALGLGQPQAAGTDYLLVTDAEAAQQPALSQQLAAAQPGLRFLLTVSRTGTLELFEYQNGHRTLLSTSQYDLDELLTKRPTKRLVKPLPPLVGPAFLRCVPPPLFFPTPSLRLSKQNALFRLRLGALAITDTRRVLHWPDRTTGARELLPAIEAGTYYFGTDKYSEAYVLVHAPGLLRVYCFNLLEGGVELIDLAQELGEAEQVIGVVFEDNCYYVRRSSGPPASKWLGSTLVFDCQQRAVRERHDAAFPIVHESKLRPDFGNFKRFINNGYSVFHRISHVGVSEAGELLVDGYALRLKSVSDALAHQLYFLSRTDADANPSPHAKATAADIAPADASATALSRRFAWPDGSEAIVDARGLLHLRSADARVPELTVLLVLGQPTAAWAANGTVAGSAYFTGHSPAQPLAPAEFYQQYIQRFTAPLR
ncbi:MAG TPA: hypothetical protein VFO93_01495 [Hymenobacter sp.]|uniref:hypothetical protein n=1 Tax=Hymenobacter sp. TaxID=1898978 RepID=UPI002D7EBC5C|nr:hypothetical protein [Hymenobacter sp.]HET9502184.1 hypothetical protein [Hymenobacter sp.]